MSIRRIVIRHGRAAHSIRWVATDPVGFVTDCGLFLTRDRLALSTDEECRRCASSNKSMVVVTTIHPVSKLLSQPRYD